MTRHRVAVVGLGMAVPPHAKSLVDLPIESSAGSRGNSYDNALAESVIGLCKMELIARYGPWKSFEGVEFTTLKWVDWFNNRRLLEPTGHVPPVEYEAMYYQQQTVPVIGAGIK